MTAPIDLDGPPACPECGVLMVVTKHADEAEDGYPLWSAVCYASDGRHPEIVDRMERPTWRTEPGCMALVAEIERLRAEAAERAAEMDRLRAELDRADPHAMTLLDQAVDRLEAERQAILDAGGDALWAGGAKTLPEAVAGALHALDVALTRSAKEYDASPAAKVRHDHPHVKVTDADLVESAVRNAGRCGAKMARWVAVKEVFGHGSGVSESLCRACGLDPDEMVGDDGDGEE